MEHLYRIGTVLFTMMILFSVQSFHTAGNAAGTGPQEYQLSMDNIQETNIESIFFLHAIEACHANIHLSRLAIQKAHSPYMKDIASTLELEHKSWLHELTLLAHKNGFYVPAGMNQGDKIFMSFLNKQPGKEFDRQWTAILIDKHDSFISEYDRYASKKSLHTSVKQWIEANLPHLRAHQDRLLMFEQSMQFE
ncbi:MAG: DUF4142 domain-containing protein [Cytophagales bacterium]|nr:DUF4142 domain-containing protein [Cytophaga sp.]